VARTITFEIAINGAFLTRRWEEPENWMRLTRECGYPVHSFCFDVLDPFFSGEEAFLYEEARKTREAADRYGVALCDLYTGVATHRFHGLSHSDPRARKRMREWVSGALSLAGAMGVDQIGGHVDAFSCEVLADEARTEEAMRRVIETYRDICREAGAKGQRAFYSEQMYIPSEVPWTLAQTERMLIEGNRDNPDACAFRVALDVGHQAGNHYGLNGDDLSYEVWLRRFGAQSELIHLQQTTQDASHHWPFTDEYNAKGHVDVQKVIDAVVASHRTWADTPAGAVLPAVEKHFLIGEFIPGSTKTEAKVLDELKRTAEYLRRYVPEGGLTVTI
jgi:D-erythrulose 1-phosphate 3-epimerase